MREGGEHDVGEFSVGDAPLAQEGLAWRRHCIALHVSDSLVCVAISNTSLYRTCNALMGSVCARQQRKETACIYASKRGTTINGRHVPRKQRTETKIKEVLPRCLKVLVHTCVRQQQENLKSKKKTQISFTVYSNWYLVLKITRTSRPPCHR